MTLNGSFSSWITQFLASVGSCLGACCSESQPSKSLQIQGLLDRKPSISEGFWSTSAHDLENIPVRTQSSISILNPSLTGVPSTGSHSSLPEFVNQGLLLWNESRLQWVGTKKPQDKDSFHESPLCWSASCESLLGTNRPFQQPIPLSDMVDILVDIWEHEGLYLGR